MEVQMMRQIDAESEIKNSQEIEFFAIWKQLNDQ